MHPVLFEIPGLGRPVSTFGVLVAAGFLIGSWLWGRALQKYGDDPAGDPDRASHVTLWILFGVLAGARLFYVVVELARWIAAGKPDGMAGAGYVADPLSVLFIWEGGLVMYGGLAGGILLGCWSAKRIGLAPSRGLDTALPAAFLGLAIGRVGCLMVGDDYGKVVPEGWEGAPFPVALRVPELAWLQANPQSLFAHDLAGQTLWATQPWMTLNALAISAIGFALLRRRRWSGQVAWSLVALYAPTRFVIEHFRGDGIRGVWFGGLLSTSQLISLVVGAVALAVLLKNRGRVEERFRTDGDAAREAA
jgi:phosphatidylglycerol:prolipoprotein diacylglycerol transferase